MHLRLRPARHLFGLFSFLALTAMLTQPLPAHAQAEKAAAAAPTAAEGAPPAMAESKPAATETKTPVQPAAAPGTAVVAKEGVGTASTVGGQDSNASSDFFAFAEPKEYKSDAENPYIQQGIVKGYAHPWQMGFQDPASPVFDILHRLNIGLHIIAALITVLVMGLLGYVCWRFSAKNNPVPSKVTHNTLIEVIWTVIPIVVLVCIAIPSLRTHFYMTKVEKPELTLKVQGNQWYWTYEYLDAKGNSLASYNSNMIPDKDIDPKKGQIRLLSVDNPLVFPVGATVRVLVTGSDVIHSFAMPSMGVKTDGVPGRMNETWFRPEKEGIFYGQCSELCGVNHAFMPIEHVVAPTVFKQWVTNAKAGNFAMDGLEVAGASKEEAAPADQNSDDEEDDVEPVSGTPAAVRPAMKPQASLGKKSHAIQQASAARIAK